MSEQLKTATEWEGRTIRRVIKDTDTILLAFTDGSYAKLVAEKEYYDQYPLINLGLSFNMWEEVKLGLLTQEEFDKIRSDERKEQQKLALADKRARYEQLKKELGE